MKLAKLQVLFISFVWIVSEGKILSFKERTLSGLFEFCIRQTKNNSENLQLSGPKTTNYWWLHTLKEHYEFSTRNKFVTEGHQTHIAMFFFCLIIEESCSFMEDIISLPLTKTQWSKSK